MGAQDLRKFTDPSSFTARQTATLTCAVFPVTRVTGHAAADSHPARPSAQSVDGIAAAVVGCARIDCGCEL